MKKTNNKMHWGKVKGQALTLFLETLQAPRVAIALTPYTGNGKEEFGDCFSWTSKFTSVNTTGGNSETSYRSGAMIK